MIEPVWQQLASIPGFGVPLALVWALYILALSLWIIWEKREPAATLGWLLALALLPLLGFLIYYLVGPRRIRRQRLRRLRSRAALVARTPEDEGDVAHVQLATLAQRITGIPPVHVIDPCLLHNGENTYDAMLAAIAAATHHIHMVSYIFDPDATGKMFLDALLERARSGVKVRLLLDSVGSARLRATFFKPLIEAGGEVAWFHPVRLRLLRRPTLNQRSHRKILIVDGTIGFTGGVNISDTQDRRRRDDAHCDLHLRFSGSAVQALQVSFLEDWVYVTGTALRDAALWPRPACGGAPALVLPSGPDTSWEAFHRIAVEMIHDATERVWLVTPYFVPSEAARMALTNAALCGVDVRVMLPRRADSLLVTAAARSYYDELLAAGVRIFEYQPNLLHTKAMLVDRRHVLIGSANFDHRSFRLNFELSILVADETLADAMEETWNDYATRALEILPDAPASRFRRMGDATARLLSPLL
ncbi:cardiolipin synthase [Xanthomonadaceae bacterium XH05]|nr:cardiolipin synthase [Xanthomonadaceae bacterium XH05]